MAVLDKGMFFMDNFKLEARGASWKGRGRAVKGWSCACEARRVLLVLVVLTMLKIVLFGGNRHTQVFFYGFNHWL